MSQLPLSIHNPFMTPEKDYLPSEKNEALVMARNLYYGNPLYRQATLRTIGHFLTGLTPDSDSEEDMSEKEQKFQKEYFEHQMGLLSIKGREFLESLEIYGTAFCRVHRPFSRFLIHPQKSMFIPVDKVPFQNLSFSWSKFKYVLKSGDGKTYEMDFKDVPLKTVDGIAVSIVDPREIQLVHCNFSMKTSVLWDVPQSVRNSYKQTGYAAMFMINNTPRKFLEVVNTKDLLYGFAESDILMERCPTLVGFSNYGWGLPQPLAIFGSLFQMQVYRKIDTVIGMDYILPHRIITPNLGNNVTADDVNKFIKSSDFVRQMRTMVQNHRKNPYAISTAPFPLNFQHMSSNPGDLISKDRLEIQQREVLDAAGYPQEFFRSSIQVMNVPYAVRMFEASKSHLPYALRRFVRFVTKKVQGVMGWDDIDWDVKPSAIADDVMRQSMLPQLALQGAISSETGFAPLGVNNIRAEVKKMAQEEMNKHLAYQKAEQDMQESNELGLFDQEGDSMDGGGGEAPGGTSNVDDYHQQALMHAEDWANTPTGERAKKMQRLKMQDDVLHSYARQIFDDMRAAGASEGRQAVYGEGARTQ